MNEIPLSKIKAALRLSWSEKTCIIFEANYPYYGQCAQTAIIIYEKFGGRILKTSGWPKDNGYGRHFYNEINGVRYDFTKEQFTEIPEYTHNIMYQDKLSGVEEATTETNTNQITALRNAFNLAFGQI